jgi:glycosyltransferase involved in cell wall biosynthesis
MVIWLIQTGEPLPIDGDNVRLYRTGILADLLVERGHTVVWWTSNFDHIQKKKRVEKTMDVAVGEKLKIKLLSSIPYKRNISLVRLINHYQLARKFFRLSKSVSKPDIIVSSFPTIYLSYTATHYAQSRNVPVVIDVRDLWPDVFMSLVPRPVRWIAKLILKPAYIKTKKTFRGANAVIGNTPQYVDWGIQHAQREKRENDRDFPLGYKENPPSDESLAKAMRFWTELGIYQKKDKFFIACYFGTIGGPRDIETLVRSAMVLNDKNKRIFFVICGRGDKLDYFQQLVGSFNNVLFPGWIGESEIWLLMKISSVGLAPYLNIDNYLMNIPNKPIEYLSSGLPVVTCLKGVLSSLIEKHHCGMIYKERNPEDLVEKLQYLYDNPYVLKKMSKSAKDLFHDQFSAEKVYGDMADYLESLHRKIAG